MPRLLKVCNVSSFYVNKMSAFSVKHSNFLQSNNMRVVFKDLLVLFSAFIRLKIVIKEKLRTIEHAFRIRLLDCSELAKNQENGAIICLHDAMVIILTPSCFSSQVQIIAQVSCQYHYTF